LRPVQPMQQLSAASFPLPVGSGLSLSSSSALNAPLNVAVGSSMIGIPGSAGLPGVEKERTVATPSQQQDLQHIWTLVTELTNPDKRETALLELSKKREAVPDLAPILWHSFGTIACLLQEIVAIYPLLSPPKLKAPASNRVCNALALLQCVASHVETRSLFLNAHIPLYLYPFFEYHEQNSTFRVPKTDKSRSHWGAREDR